VSFEDSVQARATIPRCTFLIHSTFHIQKLTAIQEGPIYTGLLMNLAIYPQKTFKWPSDVTNKESHWEQTIG